MFPSRLAAPVLTAPHEILLLFVFFIFSLRAHLYSPPALPRRHPPSWVWQVPCMLLTAALIETAAFVCGTQHTEQPLLPEITPG